jgi:hypothetical protein
MVQCPVCGDDNPPEASNCKSCQLATSLFEPVREAAGSTADDSDYARAIAEILAVVGPEPEPSDSPSSETGAGTMITAQGRFPSLSSARAASVTPGPAAGLPALPVLAPGLGPSLVQHEIEELVQIGRREGLDLTDSDRRLSAALKEENAAALDELRRSLFVQVAASVVEDLEIQSGRRNELAPLVPTASIDAELGNARTAFATGDLGGTVRRLRQASDGLSVLEDRWATCQILSTEADLMIETLRELGEDPGPALGPLSEGRRLARAGDTDKAEHVLAGANRALWEVLVPQLNASLQVIRTQLHGRASTDQEIEPVVRELRQMAALIRRRNFGAAVTAYRRLRTAAAALSPAASG